MSAFPRQDRRSEAEWEWRDSSETGTLQTGGMPIETPQSENMSKGISPFLAVRCLRAKVAGGALSVSEDGEKTDLPNFS